MAASTARRISGSEMTRWLGYPKGKQLEGLVKERVEQAVEWYCRNGNPFDAVCWRPIESVRGPEIRLLGGGLLTSDSLARRCSEAGACTLVCAALSAGSEIDREVARLWSLDRPDEAFVLDRLGVAVTDHLRRDLRSKVGRRARSMGFEALVGSGPGYSGWCLSDQEVLLSLVFGDEGTLQPDRLRALPSGMLVPKLSMLLAIPLSAELTARLDVAIPCSVCNYVKCAYRRSAVVEVPGLLGEGVEGEAR